MTVNEIVQNLDLSVCTGGDRLNNIVTGGYTGDLLSDVIANSKAGNVWVTIQLHVNIVAVAVLKDLSAIVLANGRAPAEDTLKKATEEHVTILTSKHPAFETVSDLYKLGVGRET